MIHLILCGGSGTRLWPLSRPSHPKPFLKLFNGQSLFQLCYEGNRSIAEHCLIVCNQEHKSLAIEQLKEVNAESFSFILEPVGRNTAAAFALAMHTLPHDALVLATPADAYIGYSNAYFSNIKSATTFAEEDQIALFGIEPNGPKTCYGYIQAEGENVVGFHEKPCFEKALQYILKGNYYWNSGMLCFRAKVLLEALRTHAPEIFTLSKEALKEGPESIPYDKMCRIPNISIDYAVCEKSKKLKVVPCSFRFSDLGQYDALFEHLEKDPAGNAIQVGGFVALDAKNNLVISEGKQVTAIDIEDLIIVDTPDVLLISKNSSIHKIKEAGLSI